MERNIFKIAALHAFAAFAYVSTVGLFISNAPLIFGEKDTAFTPVAVLMLLVLSASLMGTLIFGRPVMWYIDGRKKDAVYLLGYTMMSLLALTILTFIVLLTVR